MNERQFAIWCREQSVESVAADAADAAVAAHEAESDPHPVYTTAAEVATAISALNLASGTYTPTLTSVANITSSTSFQAQYSRNGSFVTVTGRVDITPTTLLSTLTKLGISLPIASNFATTQNCAGVAASTIESASILSDSTNDRAELDYSAVTASGAFYYSFSYEVI